MPWHQRQAAPKTPFSPRSTVQVCKEVKHARMWVTSLHLLRRAYAEVWGLPPAQLAVLKLAFKAASGNLGAAAWSQSGPSGRGHGWPHGLIRLHLKARGCPPHS